MKQIQSVTKPLLTPLLLASALMSANCFGQVQDADGRIIIERDHEAIVLEPYGSNIVRVTLGADKAGALTAPGYGFIAKPVGEGWSHQQTSDGSEVFQSSRLVVRISPGSLPGTSVMPRTPVYQQLIDKHWLPGTPWTDNNAHNDVISISTPEGKPLLTLWKWSMYKNKVRTGDDITDAHKNLDPGCKVSATFDSPSDEHYYGLGEHQSGPLDLRDHQIKCWPDYQARGGESVGVPFMISSRGYGLIWDNPSKTTIDLGNNQNNDWTSDVGDRISFFVIAGDKTDEIYQGYRQLTGVTHLLPKGGYGYIQSKCIYATQDQLLEVAKGYRDRHLPLDVMVVDFLHESREGDKDLDPARWPDPVQMNRQLHDMGIDSMISIWPHFATDSRYYNLVKTNHWFIEKADGTPDQSWWGNDFGPDIDVTSPESAQWFWSIIRDNYIQKDGFNYIWLDETEPDIDPENDFYSIGAGNRYYNLYPLFETGAIYDGFRRDFGDSRRAMILARAAYLGAQRNGTFFWSSDIQDTWDVLRRSITAGLNFTASGMPYWCTDIGGYARRPIHADYKPFYKPLVSPEGAEETVGDYSDYPELFVRWFEWGVFQPVMRAHGERKNNEVWSFGKEATPILEKFLKFRYQLLPYTYSLAYGTYQTGAPYMRALWMDFPGDANVANISDEYMFGPALLVAPVTDQGATNRLVYVPAGDWYNYWTNEKLRGGQTVSVAAPIDTIPLFVRAGSILPLGSPVLDANQPQKIASVRVYPGADADFTLYSDDGKTYDYESGKNSLTQLHWDEAGHKFSHTGAKAWTGSDGAVVNVIKPATGK
jgi:alpha-glucosidase/alpha-D-xyloside xylohydrolase